MPSQRRRPVPLLTAVVCSLVLAACGGTDGSASPSAGSSAAASASAPASPSASAAPSVVPPSASPSTPPTATPTTPSPSASAAASTEACGIAPQTGRLPSDRLVNLHVSSTPTSDVVQFVLGPASLDRPQGPSEGLLQAATPPYTQAASGQEMSIRGDHVAQVRFSGMSITNDAGEEMYQGPLDVKPKDTAALREVANYDMSEGYIGFYLGYDGNGCVTLTSDETSVTVTIDHPAG